MALFGATAPTPTFGSTSFSAPTTAAASSSAVFGVQSSKSPSNVFGTASSGQSQPSLFGAQQVASAPPTIAATSSAFGAQSTPSLFGAAQSAPATTAFGGQSTPSLFGAPQTAGASVAFGAQSQSSLFGAPQTTTATTAFGAQSQPSLFGVPVTTSAPSGNIFGAQPTSASPWGAAAAAPVPPTMPTEITLETNVSDLPQNLQTELLAVERHLRDQRMKAARLLGRKGPLAAMCKDLDAQYAAMAQKGARTKAALDLLSAKVETLKSAIRTDVRSSEAVLVALENAPDSSNMQDGYPSHGYGASAGWMRYDMNLQKMTYVADRSAHIPPDFFERTVRELELRANEYKREIDEITDYFRAQGHHLGAGGRTHMRGVEHADRFNSNRASRIGPQFTATGNFALREERTVSRGRNIEEIIRRQYDYFMVVASQIATVYEQLRVLKEQYLDMLRMKDPDAINPFEQADLLEKAEKERKKFMADKLVNDSLRAALPPQTGPVAAVSGFGTSAPAFSAGLFGNTTAATGSTGLFGNSIGFGPTSQSGFGSSPTNRRLTGARRKR